VGQRHAAVQSLTATYQDLFSNIIDSQEFAEINLQAFHGTETIDGASRIRLYAYGTKVFRTFQGIHWQWQSGVLDDKQFNSLASFFEDIGQAPSWRRIWQDRRHQYDQSFKTFMDGLMLEDKGRPLFPEFATEDNG